MRNLPRFTTLCLSSFALTVAFIHSTAGHAADIEVVRVGDRDMGCPALAAEINSLSRGPAAAAEAAPKPKKHGFGFLKVLAGAVPVLGAGQAIGGALLSTAAGAAQAAAADGQRDEMMASAKEAMREGVNGGSPEQQRKARLLEIFEAKRC